MICKKCRKDIPEESLYCMWCGAPVRRNPKKALYQRPDGLYEKNMALNGKRITFRGKTETEIFRKIAEYQESVKTGRLFNEVAEEWKEEHYKTIAYNTAQSYTAPYNRAANWFGNLPIRGVTPNDVHIRIGQFAKSGRSHKTVANQLLVLNLIFNYAIMHGDLQVNPAEHITVPKNLPKGKRELPSDQDLEIIKAHCEDTISTLAFFILYTGCRIGEALAIQYGDIDRENKIIHITKSVYHVSNVPHIKSPKTEAGNRNVILLDILSEKLSKGRPDDYLFPGKNGGPMTYTELKHGWEQYCKRVGLADDDIYIDKDRHKHARIKPRITPHQLRHGFATICFEAGITEKDAQELLGHTSIVMTQDTYTHIRKKRRDETAQKLNDYTQITQ